MSIFHLDIESFVTEVERLENKELQGYPFVIAPEKDRAAVVAASWDAKKLGVCRDMKLEQVRRHVPDIVIRPPNAKLYSKANRAVLGIVSRFSPIVEPVTYGHVAIDMTGMRKLFGSLVDAGVQLCRDIMQEVGLKATVGIASNKLVSTIAAKEVQKHRQPLVQIERGSESDFLGPLSSRALPEWSDSVVKKLLFELNLRRICQVQSIPRDLLSFAIGGVGLRLHRHACGVDRRPVTPPRQTRQLARDARFCPDTNDDKELKAELYRLVEQLCEQLRIKALTTECLRVSLKYSDDVWRHQTFKIRATDQELDLYKTLMTRFERLCERRARVCYLKVCVEQLFPFRRQYS